jgi:aminopeptidase-like protein
MDIHNLIDGNMRVKDAGQEMFRLIERLYPICRSITGNGVRETLRILKEYIPLQVIEVPTGTQVFDWTVPKEWNIKDAYVKNSKGKIIIDFKKSNLSVVSYSHPVNKSLSLEELKEHLYTLPDHPEWIPYRTSYYQKEWGLCLTQNQLAELENGVYKVCIDASMENGYLTYGEYYLSGKIEEEVLISCHICHPSLCNDNLSGIALAIQLAKELTSESTRYSYRFVFIPGTIGAITWLAMNEQKTPLIKHGLVLTGVGDSGNISYKKSRRGNAEIDQAAGHVLKQLNKPHKIIDFFPYGYDERQYCSPGFNLPVGCFMRTPHGHYPEYHTSADNLSFIKIESMADSFVSVFNILDVLEKNRKYINTKPKCEPQLGKRRLYEGIGGQSTQAVDQLALLWVLNMSDGENSLLDIAIRSGCPFSKLRSAADLLIEKKLLTEI